MEQQQATNLFEQASFSLISCGYLRDPFNVVVLNRPIPVSLKFNDPNRTQQDALNWVQNNFDIQPGQYNKVVNGAQTQPDGTITVQLTFNDPNLNINAPVPVRQLVIANTGSFPVQIRTEYPADFEQPYEANRWFVPMEQREVFRGEIEERRI